MIAKLLAGTALALLLTAATAQAAPTNYVTMTDGAQIAINVKVPPQCTATSTCPTFFEMSGYESGSDDGKTPIGDAADATGASDLPLPFQTGTRAAHAAHVDDATSPCSPASAAPAVPQASSTSSAGARRSTAKR